MQNIVKKHHRTVRPISCLINIMFNNTCGVIARVDCYMTSKVEFPQFYTVTGKRKFFRLKSNAWFIIKDMIIKGTYGL